MPFSDLARSPSISPFEDSIVLTEGLSLQLDIAWGLTVYWSAMLRGRACVRTEEGNCLGIRLAVMKGWSNT